MGTIHVSQGRPTGSKLGAMVLIGIIVVALAAAAAYFAFARADYTSPTAPYATSAPYSTAAPAPSAPAPVKTAPPTVPPTYRYP